MEFAGYASPEAAPGVESFVPVVVRGAIRPAQGGGRGQFALIHLSKGSNPDFLLAVQIGFHRVQTSVGEGSPLVKLRNSA